MIKRNLLCALLISLTLCAKTPYEDETITIDHDPFSPDPYEASELGKHHEYDDNIVELEYTPAEAYHDSIFTSADLSDFNALVSAGKFKSASFSLIFPILGNALFTVIEKDGEDVFHAKLMDPSKPLTIPSINLILSDSDLYIKKSGKIDGTFKGKFLNNDIVMHIEDLHKLPGSLPLFKNNSGEFSTAKFNIVLNQKVSFPIFPGQKATFDHFNLTVNKGSGATLDATVDIFGHPADIDFTITGDSMTLKSEIKELKLVKLLPRLANTQYEKLIVNDMVWEHSFNWRNLSESRSNVTGDINLTSLALPLKGVSLDKVSFKGHASKEEGLGISCSVAAGTLPVIGKVENIKIGFSVPVSKETEKPTLTLEGHALDLIPELGKLNMNLACDLGPQGLNIKGTLTDKIDYKQFVLDNASFAVNPLAGSLSINGKVSKDGIEFDINFEIVPDEHSTEKSKSFAVNAKAHKDTIKPFEKTNIPTIKDITLTDANVGVNFGTSTEEGGSQSIFFEGNTKIFDMNLKARVRFFRLEEGGNGILLRAEVPTHFKLGDLINATRGTIIENINFDKATIVITSHHFYDLETNMKYEKGIGIYGECPLTGSLEPLGKLLHVSPKETITLFGTLSYRLPDISLGAKLSKTIEVKSQMVHTSPLELRITGEPAIELLGSIEVKPSIKDDLSFTAELGIQPDQARCAATLQGLWKDPFGLKGLSISDVALDLGFNYAIFIASGLPSHLGLAGTMQLGKHKVTLRLQPDLALKDSALQGNLNELSLADIVQYIADPLGAKIKPTDVPEIALKDVNLNFALNTVRIGQIYIEQGITIQGEIYLVGVKGVIDCTVDVTGVKGIGCLSPINIGAFHIVKSKQETAAMSAKRTDRCKGMENGSIIDMQFDLGRQAFLISGAIVIDGIAESDTIFTIDNTGMTFKTILDIANGQFYADLVGKSMQTNNQSDFELSCDFQLNFIKYIQQDVDHAFDAAKASYAQKVTDAQNSVNSLNSQINDLDTTISDAKRKLQDAQNSVNSLDSQIRDAQREVDNAAMPWDKIAPGTKLAGLKIARDTAAAALRGAQSFMDSQAGKETTKAGLVASRDTAQGTLKAGLDTGIVTLEGGRYVAKASQYLLRIKRIAFKGLASQLKKGVMPDLIFTLDLGNGKEREVKFGFDFSNPSASSKSIADNIVKLVMP